MNPGHGLGRRPEDEDIFAPALPGGRKVKCRATDGKSIGDSAVELSYTEEGQLSRHARGVRAHARWRRVGGVVVMPLKAEKVHSLLNNGKKQQLASQ